VKLAELLLSQFDHEMATTHALLSRVPEASAPWKPHPKSTALGALAQHIATLVGFGAMIVEQTERDVNPPGGPPWAPVSFTTTPALLAAFDANVVATRKALAGASDEALMVPWSLKNGGAVLFAMPRAAVLRSFMISHIIHHRGQLSVYLRMLDVPLPSIYGPTADEAR
jgi:uncharacterized damage-inducible protein DinB